MVKRQPVVGTERSGPSQPRSTGRRILRVLGWALTAVIVLTIALAGFVVWQIMRSWPQTSGTIEADGLRASVLVQRDDSGIPTITAETTHDLFFAQGFVHAQDRFWEMDFRRHLTSARLSELFGESQLGTDAFLRTLGWRDIAEQEVAMLSPDALASYEAYAEGVNAYLADRPAGSLSLEYAVLGLQNADYEVEPWSPADSVAWLKAMAWDLRTNIEDETARALAAQKLEPGLLGELYPAYPFDSHPVIVESDWSSMSAALASDLNTAGSGELPQIDAAGSTQLSLPEAISAFDQLTEHSPLVIAQLASTLAEVDTMIATQAEGVGSNSWVVAGEHTDTGLPLLANDPHLGAELPSIWYQMQLRCAQVNEACPFDVGGFSFSGLPGIVIGHNQHVAWGFTNLTTDVADLYIERIDGDEYWYDGQKHQLATRTETLRVAGGEDVIIDVRSTGHGPIISGLSGDFTRIAEHPRFVGIESGGDGVARPSSEDEALSGEYAVSLRWTALDPGTAAEAIFALNLAKNFDDFRAAAAQFDVPAQNLIYADTEGNIGYQAPGRLPVRGAGDGWLPQPGWESIYDWQGYVPFEHQPYLLNPDAGYIVTANNAIVSDDYPYFLSRDWDYGYRADRIVGLVEQAISAGPISVKKMSEIQMDNQMPAARSLQRAYSGVALDDTNAQVALDALSAWNGQNDMNSAEAAFANVLWKRLITLMTGGQNGTILLDDQSRFALFFEQQLDRPDSVWWQNAVADVESQTEMLHLAAQEAYREIVELQGDDPAAWNWGDLHALTLTHGTFGTSGIGPIEWLLNRGPYPTAGGPGVVNATGWGLDSDDYSTSTVPSMRMVVDLSDWDASTWQNLTGASGHAFHAHYTDQTDDWASGAQRPWAFTADGVSAATKKTLTLTPAR